MVIRVSTATIPAGKNRLLWGLTAASALRPASWEGVVHTLPCSGETNRVLRPQYLGRRILHSKPGEEERETESDQTSAFPCLTFRVGICSNVSAALFLRGWGGGWGGGHCMLLMILIIFYTLGGLTRLFFFFFLIFIRV